jgi:hypothetical protein
MLDHDTARALLVKVSADSLSIDLVDGRTITVPASWSPRPQHGSEKERNNFQSRQHPVINGQSYIK